MTDPTPEIGKLVDELREDERAHRDQTIDDEIDTNDRIANEIGKEPDA